MQFQVSQTGTYSAPAWALMDWDRELATIQAWEDLEQAISSIPRIAKTPNTIVNLISPRGDTLSIGIATNFDGDNSELTEPLACVNFMNQARIPPYLTVIGDSSLTDENDGIVIFRYEEGTWTEILRRNCVSVDTMLRIVNYFFTAGRLPDWVQWEEV